MKTFDIFGCLYRKLIRVMYKKYKILQYNEKGVVVNQH